MGLFPTRGFRIQLNSRTVVFRFFPYGYNEWDWDAWDTEVSLATEDVEYLNSIEAALNTRQKYGSYAGLSDEELLFKMFNLKIEMEDWTPKL